MPSLTGSGTPESPPPLPPTNRWATASLVAACVWVFGIGSLAALFLARRAKQEIRAAPGRTRGEGVAIAAQVIAVLGLSIALTFFAQRSIGPPEKVKTERSAKITLLLGARG